MKKFITLMLLGMLCCAPAFAARGPIAADSAANYTADTFVNGANGGYGFGAWEFWNTAPKLADSTEGVCGNVNSTNGLAFRVASNGGGNDDWIDVYRGFEQPLSVGDILTFRFSCAWCGGHRGIDLFCKGDEHDKFANVIDLWSDYDSEPKVENIYEVNGVRLSTAWHEHAVSEVTVEQLADGIQLSVKRILEDGTTDPEVDYSVKIADADNKGPLTGIKFYAGGYWDDGNANPQNYAIFVNDLQIEGEVPEGGALTLVEDTGDWLVNTPDPTTFNYTVSIPEAVADDVQVQLALEGSFGELSARSVTIPAGQTSATFSLTAQVNRSGNYARVTVSADNYSSDYEQIYGPSFSWSMAVHHLGTKTDDWDLEAGDTVQFWINNNANTATPANAYVTASTTDGDILACSALAEWAPAEPRGTYTSGLLTAYEPAEDTKVFFQVKFGDLVLFDAPDGYGFNVFAAPKPITLEGPDSVSVGEDATFTATFTGFAESSCTISVSPEGLATVNPTSCEIFGDESTNITLTAVQAGEVTLTVTSDDDAGIFASKVVTIGDFVPALSLEPVVENGWAITAPESNVEFRVTCNRASAVDLVLEVGSSDLEGYTPFEVVSVPESVVIPAGETSATFFVGVKSAGNNCGINIEISDTADGGYAAAVYGIKGPNFRWSRSLGDDWQIPLNTVVQFWVNNDDNNFEAANAYVTATVKGNGIELDPWADAAPDSGQYTSGSFTASSAGSWPLVVKYGDAQLFDWGYYVEGSGGEPVGITGWTVDSANNAFVITIDAQSGNVWTASELEEGDWKWQETDILVNDGTASVPMTENFQVIKVTP